MKTEIFLLIICVALVLFLLIFRKKILGGSDFLKNNNVDFYDPSAPLKVTDKIPDNRFIKKPKKKRKKLLIYGKNVGRTIKNVAMAIFWIGVAASLIVCLVCVGLGVYKIEKDAENENENINENINNNENENINEDDKEYEYKYFWLMALIGLAVLIVGTFISWLNAILLYGFGSLVESNIELAEENKKR